MCRVLVIASVLVLALTLLAGSSRALALEASPAATPAAGTPPPGDFVQQRLFAEVPGQLDLFGRVPLGWFAFEPGAEVPDAFLTGPFEVAILSGTFEVRVGATETTLGPADRIVAADGVPVTARNTGTTPGFWLALSPVSRQDWGLPPDEPLSPGFSFGLLFPTQSLRDRDLPVRLSLDWVTLGPGTSLDSVDLGGETPASRVQLVVLSGAVALTRPAGAAPGGETLLELGKDEFIRPEDGAGVRCFGPDAAVLLILRVGEEDAA